MDINPLDGFFDLILSTTLPHFFQPDLCFQ